MSQNHLGQIIDMPMSSMFLAFIIMMCEAYTGKDSDPDVTILSKRKSNVQYGIIDYSENRKPEKIE